MSGATERWLAFAKQDLRVAELALSEDIFNDALEALDLARRALERVESALS